MDLSKAKVIVVVFAQHGCGPCEEYLPRFRKMSAPYADAGIPILIADVSKEDDPVVQALADRLKVQSTPTTAVLRKGTGRIIAEGNVADGELKGMLDAAMRCHKTGVL